MNELEKKNYCDEAISLKKDIETRFLALGEKLTQIKYQNLYEPYYDSWSLFLEEIRISESMASRLIGIYEKFIVEYNFAPEQIAKIGGWTVAAKLLPVSDTKEKALEYVELASNLTRKDLEITLREEKNGIETGAHTHTDSYLLRVYPCCGLKERVYE